MLDVRDHAGPCWTICATLTRAIGIRTIQPKNKKVGDLESARPHYRFFLVSLGLPFMKFGLIPMLGENEIVVSSCDSHL
jgi:hypothetical protein